MALSGTTAFGRRLICSAPPAALLLHWSGLRSSPTRAIESALPDTPLRFRLPANLGFKDEIGMIEQLGNAQQPHWSQGLAQIRGHHCTLISRNGHLFKSWPQLAEEIAYAVRAHSAIIDGEVCCLEPDGTSNFRNLLFRREWPYFYAFDLLSVDGRDIRALPLTERKACLHAIMPTVDCRLLFSTPLRSAAVICSAFPASVTLRAS